MNIYKWIAIYIIAGLIHSLILFMFDSAQEVKADKGERIALLIIPTLFWPVLWVYYFVAYALRKEQKDELD